MYRRYIPVMSPAILAALTPPDFEISFSDERVRPVDVDEPCDIVAISVKTPQANRAYDLAQQYRERGVPVVMGGVHASLMPEEALQYADAVVIGEAEGTWTQVMEDFRKGRLQREYRCGQVLDKLPAPRWDIYDKNVYVPMNSVQVARGCPVNCDMCSVPRTFGTQFRLFDLDDILGQIESLERFIFVINDNLHLAKRRVRPFLDGMAGMDRQWVGMAPLSFAKDEEY
ncbi:MAG: radical SAM protein, partial [Thermoplasmata archaeon]|nr:radical SAM protein [Thermoplasmata archaeon]